MRTEKCSQCGADAQVVRGSHRFNESGLSGVVLQGIEVLRCKKCHNHEPIIPHINEMMQVLALAVINKKYRLKGEEVRFLRKYIRMTQEEFAALIHVDKATLSKWENNEHPVGQNSERLIGLLGAIGIPKKRGAYKKRASYWRTILFR